MKAQGNRILLVTIALLMLLSVFPFSAGAATIDPATINVGDIIFFGRYPQTLITNVAGLTPGVDYVQVGTRYFKIEPIQWLVFENDGAELFLFSKYALEYRQFNPTATSYVSWADSAIRTWLNGPFSTQAFTSVEQGLIDSTDVITPDTPPFSSDGIIMPGGPDTLDKVFLLSIPEIDGATGTGKLFANNNARRATVTDYVFYAPNGGARIDSFWLRSQGNAINSARTVTFTAGTLGNSNYNNTFITARPALNLDLEKVYFTARPDGGYYVNLRDVVTFDPQNGDPTFNQYVVPSDPATQPVPNPVKAGYVFDGWWTAPEGGELWDFSTAVEGDMTLYAHWLEIFTVTFDPQNGNASFEVTATQGSPIAEPAAPEKPGYAFTGWWTAPIGGTLFEFNTPIQGNLNLYAQFEQLFSVIYQTATSDTVTNMPADEVFAYLAGDAVTVSTLVPKRSGYTFKGWTVVGIDASAVVGGVFTMPATDVVFTAVWTKDPTAKPGLPPMGDLNAIGAYVLLLASGAVSIAEALRRKTR